MPNPGKFHGKRKEFLASKRELFDVSVERNQVAETLLLIYRAYFKRFPPDLAEDGEPTDEQLAAVNDNDPEPELDYRHLDSLSGEEYEAAMEELRAKQASLEAKKGQIKRWFYYRYMRDHALDPRSADPSNPYNALLLQATGVNTDKRPRCKTPAHVWCKEPTNSARIQAEFDKIISTIIPKQRAAKRAEIANSMFKEISEEERQLYVERAKKEHEDALKKWNECVRGKIPTTPADRQRCITGCVQFMQPILDRLSEATGFKWSLIGGGPEPAAAGRLNVISMHSGTTNHVVPLNFGQAERDWYSKSFMPVYGRFLRSCYTPEECRSRALVATDLERSLQSAAMEEGADFHSFGFHSSDSRPPSTTATDLSTTSPPSTTGPSTGVSSMTSAPPMAPAPAAITTTAAEVVQEDQHRGGDKSPTSDAPAGSGTAEMLNEVTRSLVRDISSVITPCGSPVPTPVHSRITSPMPTHRLQTPHSIAVPPSGSGEQSSTPPPQQLSHEDAEKNPSPAKLPTKRAAVDDKLTPSKRSRQTVDLVHLILPDDAPSWIKSATQMLQRGQHGESWCALIAAWLVYEGQNDFGDSGKLPAKGRPRVVADWIKWARKPTYSPNPLPNLKLIEREHNAWWSSIQPAWRRQQDAGAASASGDWECLKVFGVNGLLSALSSLFFWGMALEHANAESGAWDTAVGDCYLVVRALTSSSLL